MQELLKETPLHEPAREKPLQESVKEKPPRSLPITFDFAQDKYFVYSAMFYLCGLILGSSFYETTTSETLNKILMPQNATFLNLFLSNLCLYLALLLMIIFLGLCLIGYPILNLIPAFLGFAYGMKIAYFLITYTTRGVGYVLLMIVPFYALFLTIILYTLQSSAQMSKALFDLTKEGSGADFTIKPFMKRYAILAALVVAASLFSAGMTTLLFHIVTI